MDSMLPVSSKTTAFYYIIGWQCFEIRVRSACLLPRKNRLLLQLIEAAAAAFAAAAADACNVGYLLDAESLYARAQCHVLMWLERTRCIGACVHWWPAIQETDTDFWAFKFQKTLSQPYRHWPLKRRQQQFVCEWFHLKVTQRFRDRRECSFTYTTTARRVSL